MALFVAIEPLFGIFYHPWCSFSQAEKHFSVLQILIRDCGMWQLKEAGWTAMTSTMTLPTLSCFGHDKCGFTNILVHFIFRLKNPKTGKYAEHHLKNPPKLFNDKLSHVYTAIIYPDNMLKLLLDGDENQTADLLSPVTLSLQLSPPETILDLEDKKPQDWYDHAKIPDPVASKPDDRDEEAPRELRMRKQRSQR